ncbi:amino acid adenylation domain-containing protein [Marinobacter salinisoli]|uniref:Amino acid adenylation domain-containing protein n=1 Tax=Marinobacter salinisoli TaxID=2769486 RepID=A0ABX7MNA4_9GAMM|nr:non-ribosomal peptide synthetase [Marinobacter salinisoli]QSP93688.1 amino acid adenylation domain-containing protein [Marinobacter salinisoli]
MNSAVFGFADRHDPFEFGELECTIESTESQREVWLAAQFGEGASAAFNESVFITLRGSVQQAALHQALNQLWLRHQSVRGCFSNDGEEMVVYRDRPAPIESHDLASLAPNEAERRIEQLFRSAVTDPFDLFNGPLARFDILQCKASETKVLLTLHHSVCDGWSLYILASELGALYSQASGHTSATELEPAPLFSAYADWERGEDMRPLREQSLAYWTHRFAKGIPALDLPYDRPRPVSRTFDAFRLDKDLPLALLSDMRGLAARNASTITTTLMAAFVAYLHRISGSEDIVLGIPFSGQMAKEEHSLVGHCVNIIPLYISVSESDTFTSLLRKTQQAMLEAFDNQYLTYGTLLQTLGVERDPSKPPLVSVIFNVDQANESDFEFAGLEAAFDSNPRAFENFDLNLNITLSDQSAVMECTHNLQLWNTETMDRRMDELLILMRSVLADPEASIRAHDLLRDEDRALYQEQWRLGHRNYELENTSLHGLVEATADQFPERTALVFGEDSLTYSELETRANQLAHWLMEQGASSETIVPILMDRSFEMLIAINGVLKSGAAYLPLDPEHPHDRLAFIVNEVQSEFVLTQSHLANRVPEGAKPVRLDGQDVDFERYDSHRPKVTFTATQLAYVIYTSGSTGTPKGVMLEHRSICNHMLWLKETFPLGDADAVMLKTPYTFDVSLCELFLPLMCGSKLVIARPGGHKDPNYMVDLINQHQISHMHFVPSMAYMFLNACSQAQCPSLRRLILAGEAVSTELEQRISTSFPDAECWNLYGPTEAAVHASLWRCGQESNPHTVPMGKAPPNTRLYVVNDQMQLVGPGLIGELLIAGVQVARGYINRPEMTAERFIRDPFYSDAATAYRTGDLVKMRSDGALEYIGRNDFQVKLRGLRIELGEIESVILRYPAISQCAVLAREDRKNDQRLVAYIISDRPLDEHLAALKTHIKAHLPDYMLPQHFVQLQEMPLTSSGKVDRKALPAPDLNLPQAEEFEAPESRLEQELSDIWSNVLGVSNLSVTANFFDLGGHSLLGTQMLAQVKSKYGVRLGLGKLFEAPTVRSLSRLIETERQNGEDMPPICKHPSNEPVYAIPQQQVWYLYEKIVPDSYAFNLPAVFRFSGDLDTAALDQALNTILLRHEILRANFREIDGEVQLVINADRRIDLTPKPVSDYGASDIHTLEAALEAEVAEPFDVSAGPLFKASLIRMDSQDHVLFFMIHHLVFDGWSFDLLLKELCTLYNAYAKGQANPLPELNYQFKDFAFWQRSWLQSDVMEEHLDYWRGKLAGDLPVLNLPTDFDRPDQQPHRSQGIKFDIEQTSVEKLEALAASNQTTLFMVIMSLYVLMLHRYSRQNEIVINVPVYGRHQDELKGVMGPMINVMVCRFRLSGVRSFSSLVRHVKETILEAMDHQFVPFDLLVRTVNPQRDPSRNPIAQTLFNYQDVRNRQDEMDGIQRSQINLDRVGVETDLDVWFKRHSAGIQCGFEYPVELFERETVEQFVSGFQESVKALQEQQDVFDLIVSASQEEQRWIERWNDNRIEWPFDNGFLSQLGHQVSARPTETGCIDAQQSLTYLQLNERANKLARHFAAQGIARGDIVAILLDRTVDLPLTIIALWKLGAAYVPLDALFPAERIRAILAVAGAQHLITTSGFGSAINAHEGMTLLIDQDEQRITQQSSEDIPLSVSPEQLAYVIFTSGSTGVPKGVEISHGALHNFLKAVAKDPGLAAEDRLLAITTPAFDISILELFLPLSVGATVIIASGTQNKDPHQLTALLEQHSITVLQATPATWRILLNAGLKTTAGLKGLVGGEKLPADLASALVHSGIELWNMYGPTEATVWTSCYRVDRPSEQAAPRVLIGRPLANTQLYVLDDDRNPLPPGVYGELWIGGQGLAEGYRGNPEQTAERFVPFPDGRRLYRTGDFARWTKDGQVEFGDRLDNQVKIRGYRIELEEIEIQLRAHPDVADAAVVVQTLGVDDHRLCAHVVYRDEHQPTGSELRKHLRNFLPDYMIPQQFVAHQALPLLASGKVDRKSLSQTHGAVETRKPVRPPTPTEQKLIEIWKTLLKREQISVEDQFLDVGGHSLLALKVIVSIEQRFGVSLMPQDLWVNTLEQLANLVDQRARVDETAAQKPDDKKTKKVGKTVFKRLFGS